MINKIQVFGLQRSGTNFMEWSLINNFKDLDYKIIPYYESEFLGNIEGMAQFNRPQSIKHLLPVMDYSDYVIGIYKDFDSWLVSVKKSGHIKNHNLSEKIHNEWLNKFNELPKKKSILINHSEMVKNYEETLLSISNKFKINLNDNIIYPENKMNKKAQQTNIKYEF